MSQLTPMLAGVSYARLEQSGGLQWPVPSAQHPGTPLMHTDRFPRQKARFVPVDYLPPGESSSDAYPFILITGRVLQHYNCGAQTRRTKIVRMVSTDVLEMHRDDAERLHIQEGEMVRLVSGRGEAFLPAVLSERVQTGELFTSFHFPSTNVNALLSSSADESSKCPEYKVSAVRVEKYSASVKSMTDDLSGAHWKLIT
jgi:formate dehydrogenase major subunit